MLDLFCYTGGFSLAAVRLGRVEEVLGVDSSEAALNIARRNVELNEIAGRIRFEQGVAFQKLEQLQAAGERFDGIILDPPKMARTRGGLERALKGYVGLNRLAVEVLNAGGILVTCSCSGNVMREDFLHMLSGVAQQLGREIQVLEQRGAAPDHPVSATCLETEYLKCFICRVL